MPAWDAHILLVPTGSVDLVWQDGKLLVIGSVTKPTVRVISGGSKIVGVRFLPGSAAAWLNESAADLLNKRVPLQELWGQRTAKLETLLAEAPNPAAIAGGIEAELLRRLPEISQDSTIRTVRHSYAEAGGIDQVNVAGLARALGVNERTLLRRCQYAFGYGPRMYGRIARFQRFLELLRGKRNVRLADLAVDAGFADQSHLTRDVRKLGGLSPSALLRKLRR